ncbi:DUF459 domain-containing protein [Desulfovibrio sp. JY]|nr:DUF459 domain-containing protein [Desulfovibrio sp. JY]
MQSIIKIALAVCMIAAMSILPACINTSGKSSKKNATYEARTYPAHTPTVPTAPEAEVKSVPQPAPPAAAPPAGVPLAPPPATSPRPASPEEQTKATLEPKPVQAAALPQPKSEPAAPVVKTPFTTTAKPAQPTEADKAPTAKETTVASVEQPAAPALPGLEKKTPQEPTGPAAEKTAPAAPKAAGGKVAVVGDSLAVGIGMTMSNRMKQYEGSGCVPLGKVSTGLISKRFFDWDKKLTELVAKEKLSAVVVMMGGNDANNPIAGKAAGTPEWSAAYQEKAEDFLHIASKAGIKVLWVGLPAMRDAAYNKRVEAVNEAAKAACAKVGGCSYMEASTIFTDDTGKFVQAKTIGGKKVSLRAKDGVHMTMNGYDLLCRQVLDKLSSDGNLPAEKQANK